MALPNFYFHCTTTYAILRQAGVEIGKRDFLGAVIEDFVDKRGLPTRLVYPRRCV